MDCCQGMAMFTHLQQSVNIQSNQGRKDLFKLLFNKQYGVFSGIYTDMTNFEKLYPKANRIFVEGVNQIKNCDDDQTNN